MNWKRTEDNQPQIGETCLVYDEYEILSIQQWIEIYEEPVTGVGRVLVGEGWEESDIPFSFWIPLPEKPTLKEVI